MAPPDRLGEFEELLLLGMRALGDDTYGVPVQKYLSQAVGRPVSMGAVYATLDRLEQKGLVRSAFGEATAERGGKRKRLYSVTRLGVRAIHQTRKLREQLWQAIEGSK
jgi:PadR family transcriptional regulator, regulatory protein PadR